MTEPTVPHLFEYEVEVPGTPEQVWQAIATANGISSWLLRTSLDPRVGGEVRFHMGEVDSVGEVTAYDEPRHFAVVEPEWAALAGQEGADVTPLATEFLVEAKSGGTCVVRVVCSAFGTGAGWEDDFWEGMVDGWIPSFEVLRLVLQHFPGQTVTTFDALADVAGSHEQVLEAMRTTLPADVEGEWIQAAPGSATMQLTAPVPGFLILMAIPAGEGTSSAGVRGHVFSPDAPAWVESTEKEWQAWLEGLGA